MPAIETRQLTKQYKDVTAVDRLDLTVEEGELFGLLGVNGAGKTTTVKMLSTLTAPTAGEATVLGLDLRTQGEKLKSRIAVSPQETAVAPNLTVRENLELMCGVHGFSREKTRERTEAMLRDLSLKEVEQRRAAKLSGGWQRRLSIAMALISEPRLLFLDEPTLGLDVLAREELWDVIRALRGTVTMILTTHYMEEAEALCDRVAVMKDGHLMAVDNPAALMERTGTDSLERAFVALVKEGRA